MALNANALCTMDQYLSASCIRLQVSEVLSVYRDNTGGAASATVEVTATLLSLDSDVEVQTDLTLSSYATMTDLATAINAVSGWHAVVLKSGALPTDLEVAAEQSCYLVADTAYLAGADRGGIELAINAASDAIEKYCGRTFAQTTYRRLYHGQGLKELSLGVRPIVSIDRVAIGLSDILQAKFTGLDAEHATVEVTATAVVLVVDGGADDGTTTLPFATYTTMTTMQAAIDAVNNWSCNLLKSTAGTWSTGDLLEFGPRNANRGWCALKVPDDAVDEYDIQHDVGVLMRRGAATLGHGVHWGTGSGIALVAGPPPIYPLTADKVGPVWPHGNHNVYVKFDGNFATVPSNVTDCCIELANQMLGAKKRDGGLASVQTEGLTYSVGQGPLTDSIRQRLNPYRNFMLSYTWVDV